jgi:hypothetical protein
MNSFWRSGDTPGCDHKRADVLKECGCAAGIRQNRKQETRTMRKRWEGAPHDADLVCVPFID